MPNWLPKLNILIAATLVTIGFVMVWTPIPVSWVVAAGLGFVVLLLWVGRTPRHVWGWACLFLGLESLSWPAVQIFKLRMAGVEAPSEEQMSQVVASGFLGVFFATFWLTFAYGIFRWIRRTQTAQTVPPS
jgi:hypothetical protein